MNLLARFTEEKTSTISFKATRSNQFNKKVITAQAKLIDIVLVFEVDSNVQRELDSHQVSNIAKYILDRLINGVSPIFFPPFVFSSRGHGEFNEENNTYNLQPDNRIAVLDGQHRLEAFKSLEFRLKDSENPNDQVVYEKLKRIPLTLQIYEGLNVKQEQQLFTDINSKNTRVGANLIKYYDEINITSKLMREVMHNHPSIAIDNFEIRQNTTRTKLMTGLVVYKIIAILDSGRIISNQIEYQFEEKEFANLKFKMITFLNLLVKYIPSIEVYDRSKYIYLNQSIILGISKAIYEIQDISKWEKFFQEVVSNYDWTHQNKDLRNAGVAFNYITKKFRLAPVSKVINTVYPILKNKWEEVVL